VGAEVMAEAMVEVKSSLLEAVAVAMVACC
jgi:hypothetical protein